jgi:hypothetical protein
VARSAPPAPNGVVLDRKIAASGAQAFDLASHVWTSTVEIRRTALGQHRFVPGLEPAEDRDLWVRLAASGAVYLMSMPLATAVLEPGSLSRTGLERDCTNMLRVVHRHSHLLGRRGVRRWEAKVYRRWAGENLSHGRRSEALRPAWQRWRRQPWSAEAWWILSKCVAPVARRSREVAPLPTDARGRSDALSPLAER